MIPVTTALLDQAVAQGILSDEQASALFRFLVASALAKEHGPRFGFTNVLYYFGGLLAIGAMTLFMTLGFRAFGGWGICVIAAGYAAGALAMSRHLLKRRLSTPAGILAALAIALVPLAIYGAQKAMGHWPPGGPYRDYHYWVDWRLMIMELATLAAGAVILFLYRIPFVVMPVAVTLCCMSMDFALFAGGNDVSWAYRRAVLMATGMAMILLAVYVDVRSRRRPDFAFWLYFFGAAAFWGALSLHDSNSQFGKFLYACLNALMIFAGAIIARRVFTVFGGLGLFGYLGYLSYSVFKNSLMFPLALTVLGLALVAAGVWWQRNEERISVRFRGILPAALRQTLDNEAT